MKNDKLPGIWLLEAFRRGGVDTERLARELPNEIHHMLHSPDSLTPYDVNIILANCARLSGDDNFGLHMINFVDVSMLGTFGYLLANAPTVRRFLHFAEKYYPTFYRGAGITLTSQGPISSLEYHVYADTRTRRRHDNEWSLGFFANFIKERIGKGWCPVRAEFANEAPIDHSELSQIFGDNITFKAPRTAFDFETKTLDQKINTVDANVLEVLTNEAESLLKLVTQSESFETTVRLHILEEMETGGATVPNVARHLAVSKSTLKRRLSARGLSFRKIRDDVLLQIATKALTETNTEIGPIAWKLGYSELSSFDRAFKRLTGMSPTAFRESDPAPRGLRVGDDARVGGQVVDG